MSRKSSDPHHAGTDITPARPRRRARGAQALLVGSAIMVSAIGVGGAVSTTAFAKAVDIKAAPRSAATGAARPAATNRLASTSVLRKTVLIARKPGMVVTGRTVLGSTLVLANGITFTNVNVTAAGTYVVQVPNNVHGTVIRNSTITCADKKTRAVGPGAVQLVNVTVHGCAPQAGVSSSLPTKSSGQPSQAGAKSAASGGPAPSRTPVPVPTRTAAPTRSSSPTSAPVPSPVQVPVPTLSQPQAPSSTPTLSPSPSAPLSPSQPASPPASSTAPPATSGSVGCVAHPSACGYPDASNTGAHGSLAPHGSITSTTDGQVIQNLDITGYIKVTSKNVTIQNVRITGGDTFGAIDLTKATGHTTITDVSVVSTLNQLAGMTIRDATITRANISGGQDGIDAWGDGWGGKNLVQDSYIHDLARNTSVASHDDTLQTSGGDETFRHNTLLPYDGSDPMNSCLQVGALQGSLAQLTFASNLCDGGNYSLNANSSGVATTYTAGTLTYTGNRFGRDYRYGVKTNLKAPFNVIWSGNVDDQTGAAV